MVHAELLRQLDAIGTQVDADHTRALQSRQLGYQLANQTKANDSDNVADADFRDPDRVERNTAERRETRVLKRDFLGYADDQILRGENRFAVASSLTAVSDAIADFEFADARMSF